MRPLKLPVLLAVLSLVVPAAAGAEVRTGIANDPVDQPGDAADLTSYRVDFDTESTRLVLTATYASPLPPVAAGEKSRGFYAHVGKGSGLQRPNCDLFDGAPAIHVDIAAVTARFYWYKRSVAGPSRDATVVIGEDRTQVVVTVDAPELRGADLNCVDGAGSWGSESDSLDSAWFEGFPRVPPGPELSPATRRGVSDDPRDQPPALGGPGAPDIERVTSTYDPERGFVEFVLRFYEPYDPYGGSAHWTNVNFSTGKVVPASDAGKGTVCGKTPGAVSRADFGATIDGYEGSIAYSTHFNSDFREMTIRMSSDAMVGRQYECASAWLSRSRYSSAYARGSYYSSGCDCWLEYAGGDWLDGELVFDGFSPPACRDNLDNDGDEHLDLEDPGCAAGAAGVSEADPAAVASAVGLRAQPLRRCRLDLRADVTPAIAPPALFPLAGKVEVRVQGRDRRNRTVTRTFKLRPGAARRVRSLRPGRYRISARYLGDRFRTPSSVVQRSARIARCR